MQDFKVSLHAYEKMFNEMCEKITECCIKLSKSNTEEDIMISSEVSYSLAEVLDKYESVLNKPKELLSFYIRVEDVMLDSIDKLSKTWAYDGEPIRLSPTDQFITEEAQFSDGK
jgi:hypothetical protein